MLSGSGGADGRRTLVVPNAAVLSITGAGGVGTKAAVDLLLVLARWGVERGCEAATPPDLACCCA